MRRRRTALVAGTIATLSLLIGPAAGQSADTPPPQELRAGSSLPPGESGFTSVTAQAQGTASGDNADFGAHQDDQREQHWNVAHKPANFHAEGTPEQPKDGVRIYRDSAGVPAVYGDTGRDVWWGAGYAAAQDRLFLMDAVRRTGEGTLAELTGSGDVPADVQARVLTYSDAEYDALEARLSPEARDAFQGYVDGANAWREKVIADPRLLPAEYVLLSSVPEPFTVRGSLAGGVYITRYVASEGGNEMDNVAALRELTESLGRSVAHAVFTDLVWNDDAKAAVTIPASEGRFPNQPTPPGVRKAVFDRLADWAATLPPELASGPGTGAFPVPDVPPASAPTDARAPAVRVAAAKAAKALSEWRARIRGGSWGLAIGPSLTKDGNALLMSEPQLPFSYPSLLWEYEVHGGGYDARGVSVPGLPTVGIGWGERIAWALTTGYSKTIDSFVETVRGQPGALEYLHDGTWKPADCRTETVNYRQAPEGVPVGPPVFTVTVPVCRTVHGPIVATSSDGTLARSVQYAIRDHEIDTVEGTLQWNRADTLAEFEDGVRKVSWNENVVYADADGHIAYWHPGRYPRRNPQSDQRLPVPGTGGYDFTGWLAFDEMPHVVDPAKGYLANWNNKPAVDWFDGIGTGDTSRPAGPVQRVVNINRVVESRRDWSFDSLPVLDRAVGSRDVRQELYLPLVRELSRTPGLSATERTAVGLLLGWRGDHFGPGADTSADLTTDGAAPALYDELVLAVRRQLFTGLLPDDGSDAILDRLAGVGSHKFDAPPLDNLAMRALRPSVSALGIGHDYLRGRAPLVVFREALADAVATLQKTYPDITAARRDHPRTEIKSLTGVIGPPTTTMPYLDRGTWVHVVGFTGPGRRGPAGPPVRPHPLPATGAPAAVTALAALITGAAVVRARRRRPA